MDPRRAALAAALAMVSAFVGVAVVGLVATRGWIRRQRLMDTRAAVPGTLWAVLASMIGLLVFFIAVTDMPYRATAASGRTPTSSSCATW